MSTQPVAGRKYGPEDEGRLTFIAYPNREAHLMNLTISRAMPIRDRRIVGPWCFLDRFGPLSFGTGKPMDVPPHPHIGIQTVSWVLEGEVQHSDSLGSQAMTRPGGVNVMTAGSGIAHAEETPVNNSGRLNGVQLWVALPEAARNQAPTFDRVAQAPVVEAHGGTLQVFAGAYGGETCPAPYYSAIIGLDVQIHAGETLDLALDPSFEHAALMLGGDCWIEGQPCAERMLYYLGSRRQGITLTSQAGGRLLLIGGPPFPETILMWWNFVARAPEEIAQARADWELARQGAATRFGQVIGAHAPMLAAPALVRFARPNPAS